MSHHPSYWEKSSLLNYDYLILGAGLTGLYTALELKENEPNARIAILEKGPFSMGASTRNAGFACFGNISELLDDLKNDQTEQVYTLMANRFRGIEKTRKLLGDKNIGFEHNGSLEIFSKNKEDRDRAFEYLPEANRLMKEFLNLNQVYEITNENRFDFKDFSGAISNNYEGQVHTGKLYSVLWDKVSSMNVKIYGGAEVAGWNEDGNHIAVETSSGIQFKAEKLLICNNAFASQLIPDLDIEPARGQVIVTEPVRDLPIKGIFHHDKGYYYWRNIDNRILLGGARNMDKETETTYDSELNLLIQNNLKQFLKENILNGKHPDIQTDFQWSGIMGMGSKKRPIVKALGKNIWIAARLGGMGLALSSVVGKELAELAGK